MATGITILRIISNTSRWQTWAVCIVMFLTVSTCIIDFGWFLVITLGLTIITGVAGTLKSFYAATMNYNDLTWAIFSALVWFAIESVLIFVCSTVPSLHPLYERYIKTRRLRHGSQDSPARVRSATNVKSAGHDGSKTSSAKVYKVPWAGDSFGASQYTMNDNEAQHQEPNPRRRGRFGCRHRHRVRHVEQKGPDLGQRRHGRAIWRLARSRCRIQGRGPEGDFRGRPAPRGRVQAATGEGNGAS
ncbi:hypothetical protein MAJ_10621, partial [Metarhizium majus ARSEF 297]